MNIERDKFYKTRRGKKVRVICVDAPGFLPVIAIGERGELFTFGKDGKFYKDDKESSCDLISEWTDKPVIDRAILPAWANKAIAMDPNGEWYSCSAVPVMRYFEWRVRPGEELIKIPTDFAPAWTGDWKESLVVFED